MFFFKKKTAGNDTADTPLKRKAKAMPMTKKVQFCYIKPDELNMLLNGDINSVLTLEPVNYYAEKKPLLAVRFLLHGGLRRDNYAF